MKKIIIKIVFLFVLLIALLFALSYCLFDWGKTAPDIAADTLYETPDTPDARDTADSAEESGTDILYEYNDLGYDYRGNVEIMEDIDSVQINWFNGNVRIYALEVEPCVYVSGNNGYNNDIYYKVADGTLSVAFTGSGTYISENSERDVSIAVPTELAAKMKSIQVNGRKVNVDISGLTADSIEIDIDSGTVSGNSITSSLFEISAEESNEVSLIKANVGTLRCSSLTGDLKIVGAVDELDFESDSGNIKATLSNSPRNLSVKTVAGDAQLILPTDIGGFTVKGTLTKCSYETTIEGDKAIYGDGSTAIEFESETGKLSVLMS